MTDRQQFIRSLSRRAVHLYCTRCGEPPRFAGGLCGRCDAVVPSERHTARPPTVPASSRT